MTQVHPISAPSGAAMRNDEFQAVCKLLYKEAGIVLNDGKRDLVRARLAKRLRHHGVNAIGAYLKLLSDQGTDGPELQEFINCLTTNKTDFFREPHHFDYLREVLIPQVQAKGSKRLRIWSAGCSSGEEPYTLAITLLECCAASEGWDARILASDIDTAVLAAASKGIYDADRVGGVPQNLLRKYFLRGSGANAGKVAVRSELRNPIEFRQVNFMDDSWPVKGKFDAIFCRNVMIYFDRETQRRLLSRFATMLEPDGIVVLGHSESLYWMTDTFASVGNTIYRARACEDSPRETQTTAIAKPPRLEPKTVPEIAKPAAKPIPNPKPVARTPSALPAAKGKSDGREYAIILGEVQTTVGPAVIKTLLGSCVSACIYDPATGIGGMNHFSLPGVADGGTCARYGAYAMELLITAIMKKGGDRSRLRAKVFGGAKVLKIEAESMNVGAKNAAFVLQYLEDEGIPIEAQCLGGTRGLLVRFHPNTGKAQAKPLVERDLSPVIERERKFGRELLQKVESPAGDAITLF